MTRMLIRCVWFVVIGAAVYGACRLLRCRRCKDIGIAQPRRSALRALCSVGISMSILFLLMFGGRRRTSSALAITQASDLLSQLVILVLYIGPAAIFMMIAKERLRTVGIGTHNLWQGILIGACLACSVFFLEQSGFSRLFHLRSHHAISLIYYAFGGFGEEFLFRGYLQTRLVRWLGTWKGWLIASVIMALVHWPDRLLILNMATGDAFVATISLVPVSLLFGFIMLRTQNIMAPGLFHTFANWVSGL